MPQNGILKDVENVVDNTVNACVLYYNTNV